MSNILEGDKQLVMFGISKLAHDKHFDCRFKFYLNLLINRTLFECSDLKPDKTFNLISPSYREVLPKALIEN